MNVLFVCTQNVFRSYSAECLFTKYLEDNSIKGYTVSSAGTIAYDFETPYFYTLRRLEQLGVVLDDHKNRKLNGVLIDQSDVIICMTKNHKQIVEKMSSSSNVYLFNELALGLETDLRDDTETSFNDLSEFVVEVVDYIHENIPNLYEKLKRIS